MSRSFQSIDPTVVQGIRARLRLHRRDLTQARIAAHLGVSESALSQALSGRDPMPVEWAVHLAELAGHDVVFEAPASEEVAPATPADALGMLGTMGQAIAQVAAAYQDGHLSADEADALDERAAALVEHLLRLQAACRVARRSSGLRAVGGGR